MVKEFTRAFPESELPEGRIKAIEINGHPVAIARYQGIIYAVDDICTHDGGHLGEGDVVKGQVQCPRHGARFELATGQVTRMPAVFPISRYETKIENGEIYVEIPEEKGGEYES